MLGWYHCGEIILIIFVKDELSRLGDGGAVKIFTDVSSGGKVSRKEHSVKVTHN